MLDEHYRLDTVNTRDTMCHNMSSLAAVAPVVAVGEEVLTVGAALVGQEVVAMGEEVPYRILAQLVSVDGSGASTCIRDYGGTLCWAVTFVNQISGEHVEPKVVVTSDHVSVFDVADLCLDADSDRQFRVLDARGKVRTCQTRAVSEPLTMTQRPAHDRESRNNAEIRGI
jgi:hypothetical protein